MIKFDRPINLNGAELRDELRAAQIIVTDDTNFLQDDGQGNLFIGISASYKDKAAEVVAAHNGTTVAPDRSADKAALLAKLGITADEAKLLLS